MACSWLCIQGSSLDNLRRPYGVPEIKWEYTVCKEIVSIFYIIAPAPSSAILNQESWLILDLAKTHILEKRSNTHIKVKPPP